MKYFNCPMSSSLFSSFQGSTKCKSSLFADTCTLCVPIFMILVCTSMFCKIIFQSKTFFRLHDLLSPWPVTKLKRRVDVSCDVS